MWIRLTNWAEGSLNRSKMVRSDPAGPHSHYFPHCTSHLILSKTITEYFKFLMKAGAQEDMRVDPQRISGTHGWCSSPRSSRCECSRTRISPRRISRTHPSADRANNSRDWLRKRGNDQKQVLTLQLQLCWALGLLYLEHWSPPKACSQVLYLLACSC